MLNNLSSYSLLCCREGFLSSWPSSGPTLQGAQLCAEDPRGGCSFPGTVSQGQRRRRSTSLDLLATMLLMLARMWLAFWAASAHCQLMSSISCPAFHPQESPSPSLQGHSQWLLLPVFTHIWGCPNTGAGPCTWTVWTKYLSSYPFVLPAKADAGRRQHCGICPNHSPQPASADSGEKFRKSFFF